jgi:hypothetical protein
MSYRARSASAPSLSKTAPSSTNTLTLIQLVAGLNVSMQNSAAEVMGSRTRWAGSTARVPLEVLMLVRRSVRRRAGSQR